MSYRDRLVLIELGQLSINQLQSHTELLQAITPFTIDYKHMQYTHSPYYRWAPRWSYQASSTVTMGGRRGADGRQGVYEKMSE